MSAVESANRAQLVEIIYAHQAEIEELLARVAAREEEVRRLRGGRGGGPGARIAALARRVPQPRPGFSG